ncbi:MAG: hypothetical protein J5958_01835 [Clostridia bacterium]|nr:hypothetical protein [Clostridia bacterium]
MELAMAILSAVAAVAAAATAIVTFFNGKRMEYGNAELQIRTMISEANYHLCEAKAKYADKPQSETLDKVFKALNEDIMNVYDEACAKYNDKKVDRERFKKMYVYEIRQLVEAFPEKYGVTTKYAATLRVYQEWQPKG